MADYAISNVPRRVVYAPSGVGPYAFTFEILDQTDIAVYKASTLLTLTTDYTVTINANGTGSVTLVATAGTSNITIVGARAIQRSSDYTTGGDLFASTLNTDLDSQTIYSQQVAETAERSLKNPVTDSTALNMNLPTSTVRANKVLGFNAIGEPASANTTLTQLDAAVQSFVNATGNNAASIFYNPAGTGAVTTTVEGKLRDSVTVEDFGAVGDGVTNDSAAFNAMIAATGGYIRLLNKVYNVQSLTYTSYDKVVIQGALRPETKSDLTQLQNGSILIGSVYVEANHVVFENFGVDSGSARTVASRGGLWANAKPSENGVKAAVRNVIALNESDAGVWHGVTVQGYEYNELTDIHVVRQQFGIVMKGRNCVISNVIAVECRTASVYPKSDVPAFAGNVANGTVTNVVINNVISLPKSTNVDCAGVYCHASSAAISKVSINNVYQAFGLAAVRIQGGGTVSDPTINAIQAVNVISDSSQYSVLYGGYTYDTTIKGVNASNPATGKAVLTTANSVGWNISDVHTLISNAAITADTCLEVYNVGLFDNITVRNPYRNMKVAVQSTQLSQICTGKVGYGVFIENEGNLTGINGTTLDASDPAKIKIMPRSVIQLAGKFNTTSTTNKAICNLPINTGKQMVFTCAGIDSSNAYVSIVVRLNDFQLTVEPSLPSGFKAVDISNISIPLL